MAFSHYPKMLNHPNYQPRKLISPESPAMGVNTPVGDSRDQGATARFVNYRAAVWSEELHPPVIAHTQAEEEKFAALGYQAVGAADPTAFAAARAAKFAPEVTEFREFPKYLTPPRGGEPVLVRSSSEQRTILAQWSDK
jgi:hypothetical protein